MLLHLVSYYPRFSVALLVIAQGTSRNDVIGDPAQVSFFGQLSDGTGPTASQLTPTRPHPRTRVRLHTTRGETCRRRRRSGERRSGLSSRRFKSVCRRVAPTLPACWLSQSTCRACSCNYCGGGRRTFHSHAHSPVHAATNRSQGSNSLYTTNTTKDCP